ncbi:hypothetical protein [Chryseolinea serpens]|nr:hypothetical protein [Chryseolinea serpens]
MKNLMLPLILTALLSSCTPDSAKETMNDELQEKIDEQLLIAENMLNDREFKNAIAHIELHKLRNGNYPNALSELMFLTAMDSSIFYSVEYTRLDSVYELNINFEHSFFGDEEKKAGQLKYPPEFWKGLGCVKSNVK